MEPSERRQAIIKRLKQRGEPVTGESLAEWFDVSRQVIVQDIAILRAAGEAVMATPRGYQLDRKGSASDSDRGLIRTVAVTHSPDEVAEELQMMVDHGAQVLDVMIDHPLYGEQRGNLQLKSRYDVDQFVGRLQDREAKLLLTLTGGPHLHTLRVDSEQMFMRIKQELRQAGFLLEEDDNVRG